MNGPVAVTANFASAVVLTVKATLLKWTSFGSNDYEVRLDVCNSGAGTAQNVRINSITLKTTSVSAGSASATFPSVNLPPFQCTQIYVGGRDTGSVFLGRAFFPIPSIGASGARVPLRYSISYTGSGAVLTSAVVTLP
jgi:hypothetical protein